MNQSNEPNESKPDPNADGIDPMDHSTWNRLGAQRASRSLSRQHLNTEKRLLTPGEVAALFRVDPKTVTRWAAAGRISSIRTPGGHRRFREDEVRALLEKEA